MTIPEKFDLYAMLLREWSQRMNLVAKSTLDDMQTRHFADSAQLAKILPKNVKIIDLGSGAGFPGVVLAILGWDVICIESIGKKVKFLAELKRKLKLSNLTIYHGRVENYVSTLPQNTEIIFTARAFAPLVKILDYVHRTNYRLFLLKGRQIRLEIADAKKKYHFKYKLIPSETGNGGFIIKVQKDR